MFDEVAGTDEWDEVSRSLSDPGFVAVEDNGHISEGDYRIVDEDPGVNGLFIDNQLFPVNEEVPRNQRESGGFHFRNSDGSQIEMKYRFPEELRSYPETIHVHNVDEVYFPTGEFTMDVASLDQDSGFREISFEEPLVVPAGMYHGITSREEDAGLVVVRGDPKLQEEVVGKWDENGDQLYDHINDLEFPELTFYEESQDEMYCLR